MAFKMNGFDDDEDDDDEVVHTVGEQEPTTVNEDNEEEEEQDDNAASETVNFAQKPLNKRKQRHIYDDEEFEGTAEVKQHTNKPQRLSVEALKKQQEAAQLAEKQKKEQELLQPRDWRMEMLFISFISLYLVWFVIGMIVNTRKARHWYNSMRGFLDEQFAQIGDPVRHITDLERESFHQFYLQTTGRVNTIGARFLLDLKHRQDVLTSVAGLFLGKRDLVTLDVMLQSQTPVVLAMMKNSEKKSMTDDNKDLSSSSVTAVPVSRLNAVKVTLLTDNQHLVDVLVDDRAEHGRLLSAIESNSDLFVSMHVTDKSSVYQTTKNVLRVVLRLPSSSADMARLADLLRAALAFGDNVATLKMSKGAQARASAVRQAEKKEKERRALEEKREAAEKAKEEKYKNMTPEQRAKVDEKARRRQEKKQKVRIVRM